MGLAFFNHNRFNFLVGFVALIASADLSAQVVENQADETINWYYSSTFGTGVYSTDTTTVTVFRIPLSKMVQESQQGRWGVNLLLPITLGYHNYAFDDIAGLKLPSDLGTISFVPGTEFRYQLSDKWLLKPFGQAGVGLALDGDSSALIYAAGVRSRYYFDDIWMLGNALYIAGYDAVDGTKDDSIVFMTGINHVWPVTWNTFGRETDIGLHLNYYLYPGKMDFDEVLGDPIAVLQEGEVAVTMGWPKSPTLLGVPVERLGIAFRYSDRITGWRLVTEYPF